jgi:hypothetical protein
MPAEPTERFVVTAVRRLRTLRLLARTLEG